MQRVRRVAIQFRNWLLGGIAIALLAAILLATVLAISTRRAIQGLLALTAELDRESKLRQEAESTLRQAQKMEAVGQLTGGVAHDFNNLLTVIMGNLDTMRRQLAAAANPGDAAALVAKLTKPLDASIQGANSAAQLTHRLLAFSRRQPLEPSRVDANRLVSGMLDMLRRSLGADVSIETVLGAGVWPTFADPHQLENALLNLALNAKDAMPNGGCLTIETANTYLDAAYVRRFGDVAAGQYVVLCVTDTGTGIPKEILDRVFEPFFTTKPAGEGSGLGLAMVHGFVKQSGGHMRIYSEEGHGTTVKIYLPRLTNAEEVSAAPAGKAADVSADTPRAQEARPSSSSRTMKASANTPKRCCEELGYRVVEAGDADQALGVLNKTPASISCSPTWCFPVPATAGCSPTKAREKYPDLPVLYTTGYTRNAIVHQGRLDRRCRAPEQALYAAGPRPQSARLARRITPKRACPLARLPLPIGAGEGSPMVQFTLPKNSKVKQGKAWNPPPADAEEGPLARIPHLSLRPRDRRQPARRHLLGRHERLRADGSRRAASGSRTPSTPP